MPNIKMGLVIGLSTLAVVGCSQRMVDFTALSTKSHEIPVEQQGQRTVGQDCAYRLLGIPLGSANLKEAVDRTIENGGTEKEILVDGVVSVKSLNFLFFAKNCYEVEGTPVKVESKTKD